MAQKKSTPIPAPPPSESEEDSSTEEEDEEDSSSTEEDNVQTIVNKKDNIKPSQPPSRPFAQIPKPPANDQMSEEESESESDSDSDEPVAPASIKAIPSPSPAKNAKVKRVAETEVKVKDVKRLKGKNPDFEGGERSEDVKKQLFQRLWSEEDEVALLEGACAFGEKTGINVVKDMTAFYEFIKNDMHFDVSLTQMKDKFWRLKKRFENGIKTGDKKTFTNEHNRKIFELSKKLWKSAPGSVSANGKTKVSSADNNNHSISFGEGKKKMGELEMCTDRYTEQERWVMKKGVELSDGKKKKRMNETFRSIQVEELELFMKRNDALRECGKVVLAHYSNHKKSDDEDGDNGSPGM